MIIYVDIDETICTHFDTSDGPRDYSKANPLLGRIEKINKLFEEGNTIVYWTARGTVTGLDWYNLTENQLNLWGAKYTQLKMGKPAYDLFIDDKNINSEDYFK
jgi:hypothetical protein